jgi:hypothetical protein
MDGPRNAESSVVEETEGAFQDTQVVDRFGVGEEQKALEATNYTPFGTGSFGSQEAFIEERQRPSHEMKGRGMPQESEQPEELSSDVKRFCALLARIMYRCLKERDPRLLALLKEPTGDSPEGEDRAVRSEDIPDQSA